MESRVGDAAAPPLGAPARVAIAAAAIAGALALGVASHRSLFDGGAQSVDAALHARSLWAVAHGRGDNSLFGMPVLAIHASLGLVVLAPLARLVGAANALVAGQAAALGATLAIAAREGALVARERGASKLAAAAFALLAAGLVTLGTPLVLNPFFFDVRPEILGVPVLAWALVRAARVGSLDRASVAALIVGVAMREDFAMVAAPALVFLPATAPRAPRRGLRFGLALAALAWLAAYVLVVRPAVGGAAAAERYGAFASHFVDAGADATPAGVATRARIELALVTLGAAGGFAARGRRFLLPAVPGVALLFATTRLPALVLDFHYAMFAAPALVGAAAAGARTFASRGAPRAKLAIAAALAMGSASFFASSTAPGGGRHRAAFYGAGREGTTQRAAHALLGRIPAGAGAAVPWTYAAPLADRASLYVSESIGLRGARDPGLVLADVPGDVDWIALRRRQWRPLGRELVEARGFRAVGFASRSVALLSRGREAGERVAPALVPCARAIASWPTLGVEVCDARVGETNHLGLALRRRPEVPRERIEGARMTLGLAADEMDVAIAEGLVPFADAPTGHATIAESERAFAPGVRDGWLAMRDRDGALAFADVRDESGELRRLERAPITWEAAR